MQMSSARALAAALAFLLSSSVLAAAQSAGDLKYYCEDIPPSNYLENGELKGASVEILKLLWRKMGVAQQPINVVPWARGYEMAKTGKGVVLFSMSRTPGRETLFKWVGPIFTVRNVFLGLAGRKLEIGRIEDAKKYVIGVVNDDVAELNLRALGFGGDNLQSVADLDHNFEKLRLGRIDLIAHSLDTFDRFIAMHSIDPSRYQVYFELSRTVNYYAFSRDIPDSLVDAFQAALDGTAVERAGILKRYGASP
jgi:polar amino acid transport system substrate-binding protein